MNDSLPTQPTRFNRLRWIVFSLFAIPLLGVIVKVQRDASKLKKDLVIVSAKNEEARNKMLAVESLKLELIEKD